MKEYELSYQAEEALRKLKQANDSEAATLRKRADEAVRQVTLGARTMQGLLQISRIEKNIILEDDPAGMQTYEQERTAWKAPGGHFPPESDGHNCTVYQSWVTSSSSYFTRSTPQEQAAGTRRRRAIRT